MRKVIVLVKKELMESSRKYKLLVMLISFFLIGIISPIGTKYLGEILRQLLPEGYVLNVRKASEIEAYFQFFKNLSQIGLIVLIFVTSSLMSEELEKRTIVNVLTKGIDRKYIIISKFLSSSLIWAISYTISFVAFRYYVGVFWKNEISILPVTYSNLIVFEYGLLIIGINLLLGLILKNRILTVVFCFIFNLLQMFISIFPQMYKILPISLLSQCVYIVEGKITIAETSIATVITLVCIILSLLLAIYLFRRKEIEQ